MASICPLGNCILISDIFLIVALLSLQQLSLSSFVILISTFKKRHKIDKWTNIGNLQESFSNYYLIIPISFVIMISISSFFFQFNTYLGVINLFVIMISIISLINIKIKDINNIGLYLPLSIIKYKSKYYNIFFNTYWVLVIALALWLFMLLFEIKI